MNKNNLNSFELNKNLQVLININNILAELANEPSKNIDYKITNNINEINNNLRYF